MRRDGENRHEHCSKGHDEHSQENLLLAISASLEVTKEAARPE
jgi:hypothetical protein